MTETYLLALAAHFLVTAIGCWLVTQWVHGISPQLLSPKPSTWRSRLLTRLVALLVGVVLGAFELAPAFGDETTAGYLVGGMGAGVFASVGHKFIGALMRKLQAKALDKVAGGAPKGDGDA